MLPSQTSVLVFSSCRTQVVQRQEEHRQRRVWTTCMGGGGSRAAPGDRRHLGADTGGDRTRQGVMLKGNQKALLLVKRMESMTEILTALKMVHMKILICWIQ